MISIANKEIVITVPFDGESTKIIIDNISLEDEFEIDLYYYQFAKQEFEDDENGLSKSTFEFVRDTLKTKESLMDFVNLGKRIVGELNDSPLLEVVIKFYIIIILIQNHRLRLKKK